MNSNAAEPELDERLKCPTCGNDVAFTGVYRHMLAFQDFHYYGGTYEGSNGRPRQNVDYDLYRDQEGQFDEVWCHENQCAGTGTLVWRRRAPAAVALK